MFVKVERALIVLQRSFGGPRTCSSVSNSRLR